MISSSHKSQLTTLRHVIILFVICNLLYGYIYVLGIGKTQINKYIENLRSTSGKIIDVPAGQFPKVKLFLNELK